MSADTTLDYALDGQPFAAVPPDAGDPSTLDYALAGVPFFVPAGPIEVNPTVTESTTATDDVAASITRSPAVTETAVADSSATTTVTRGVFVAEATTASDSVSVAIVHAEDVVAGAASGLDYGFEGQPFFLTGADDTFTLDWAFEGRPFVITSVPFSGRIQPSIKIFSDPQML